MTEHRFPTPEMLADNAVAEGEASLMLDHLTQALRYLSSSLLVSRFAMQQVRRSHEQVCRHHAHVVLAMSAVTDEGGLSYGA